MKHWTSRLTAVLLAGVLLCAAGAPAVGAETPQSEWYAHFEQAGVADTIQAGMAAEVSLVETESQGGLQSVKLVTSEEGWPDADRQCLQITPASGDTFDASGYTHLIFYIKDVRGQNTLCCFLSDGTVVSGGTWTDPAQQGQWTRMVIDLRNEVYSEVDKSQLRQIVLAQYTAGTYYIDSVCFATSADAPLPPPPQDVDNRFTRLFTECETVYEAGRQEYSETSWNQFALVMEVLSAQKDALGNLDGVTLGQYHDTLWTVYHGLQKQEEIFLPGDVNLDGTVNSVDARLVLQYAVGAAVFTDQALTQADITDDGTVDSNDARVILQRSVA